MKNSSENYSNRGGRGLRKDAGREGEKDDLENG